MAAIGVRCDGGRERGWTCTVTIDDEGGEISTHRVDVRSADLDRLDPGAADPAGLVQASFAFLLEREPPELILRSFDLTDIARYFPDYDGAMRARHGG